MRRRAVIFDDNEFLRSYLWQFFDRRGYEVFTFPEPDLCPLHVVRQCPCPEGTCCADLIISDVNMLGKNGLDYIEKLLKKGCKQRHFALISGAFSDADMVRAAQMGCALFSKPLEMDVLKTWVEAVEQSILPERQLHNWA
jgi:DNA-binding response OmpR family regulator